MCGLSVLTMNGFDIEERVERAVKNFMSGYNCAQSVFLAYSDLFGLDMEIAKSVSVSFGGGMGRMREVCGAGLCLDAFNSIQYAYAEGETGDITLTADWDEHLSILTFSLIDAGIPFDPTQMPDADTTLSADERPIGGLGILLIRKIMDSVSYQRIGNENHLVMTKKI